MITIKQIIKTIILNLALSSFFYLSCDDTTINSINGSGGFTAIDCYPSWSPDGRKIAYEHGDTSLILAGIYTIDTNGSNKKLIVSGFSNTPDWSPDGNWIAFTSGGHIFKIKVNGDSLTQLTFEGSNFFPTWNPDGEWIIFDSDNESQTGLYTIWKMKSDGTNKIKIINPNDTIGGRMPDWSHNGYYFACQFYDLRTGYDSEIAIIYNNGLVKKILTFNDNIEHYPKFSPDDSKVIFTQEAYEGINMQLYSVDVDGTNLKRLTDGTQGYTADYSPDGQYVVYCNSSPGHGRLWIMKEDGSYKKQLTF